MAKSSTTKVKSTRPKRKVPNKLFTWDWFKKHFLDNEDRRKLLVDTLFTKDEFITWLKSKISFPGDLPSHCRSGSKRTRETLLNTQNELLKQCYTWYLELLHKDSVFYAAPSPDRGIGLFSRQTISVKTNECILLTGNVYPLKDETFAQMIHELHPSLYQKNILYGPISLFNHDCSSPFRFSGKKYIKVKNIRTTTRSILGGSEVFVNYFDGNRCDFDDCSKCNKRSLSNK
jgi:hypothetical protein